jgi:hypothetical protein
LALLERIPDGGKTAAEQQADMPLTLRPNNDEKKDYPHIARIII